MPLMGFEPTIAAGRGGEQSWQQVGSLEAAATAYKLYKVIRNDCRGFNNLSHTIHSDSSMYLHRWIKKFSKFYNMRYAVVRHY
jgi:hypothetical protein